MADSMHFNNLAESFAKFTDTAIKLKESEFLTEDALTKVKDTAGHFIEKVHEALTKTEVLLTPPPAEKPEETTTIQQSAPQTTTIQQPAQATTPPPAQLYVGYTLMQLKSQNVTTLRDVAISIMGRPNASKSLPQGTGAMEQVYKDELVQYIVNNAQFA